MNYVGYQCANLMGTTGMKTTGGPLDSGPKGVILDDKLVSRMMTLMSIMNVMAIGEDVYTVLCQISEDDFIRGGGGTIVDVCMKITCGDGTYMPLDYFYYN